MPSLTRKDTPAVQAPPRGVQNFDRDRNSPLDANHAYATTLLGNFSNYTEATGGPRVFFRCLNMEWYAQDNWRVRRGLTLDYGDFVCVGKLPGVKAEVKENAAIAADTAWPPPDPPS
jgi:hypothetical protein